jgi:deoxycytidylate deaminase
MTNTVVRKLQNLRRLSNHKQHKLSALILHRGRPISFGYNNQTKTHPKIKKYSDLKTLHAEMSALFKIKNKSILKDCTMVIYREHRNGVMANAKPCEVCTEMLRDYGITQVIYSTPNGWIEEIL